MSGIPHLHFSFAIHSFIPRRFLEVQFAIKTATVFGCFGEGMRLPSIVHQRNDGIFVKKKFCKDPDVLFYHTKDVVLGFPGSIEPDNSNYVISTESVHIGYCLLKVLDNGNNVAHLDLQVNKKGVTYLSSAKSKKKFEQRLKVNKKAIESMLDMLMNQGSNRLDMKFSDVFSGVPEKSLDLGNRPHTTMGLRGMLASTRQDRDSQKKAEQESGLINEVESDEVGHELAFPFPEWPPMAGEFVTRKRPNNWPSKGTVDKVLAMGIHIVPMANGASTDADIEWRMSFIAAEKKLILEELDDSQRQCYLLTYLLCLHTFSEGLILPCHLKAAFLYTCEEIDPRMWHRNPAHSCFLVFDRIIEGVRQKNLPCYFIKKNNMIDHLTDLQFSQLERRLMTIRKKPVVELLSLADNYTLLDVFPYNLDVKRVFAPVMGDAKKYEGKSQALEAVEVFIKTSNTISNGFYHEFGYDHCASILDDVVDYIVEPVLGHKEAEKQREYIPHLLNQRNIEFSNDISPSEIWKPITFSRYLIRRYVEGDTGSGLFEHLACLYHAAANIFKENRVPLLREADEMFQQALNRKGEGHGPGMFVEYAQFLCSSGRHEEAVPHLMTVLSSECENPTCANYYGQMEIYVVDDFVRKEIEVRGYVEVLSIVYAYYLLVDCFVQLKKQKGMSGLVNDFEQLCERLKDSMAFSLFGYAMKKAGDNSRAGKAFRKAVDLEPSNKLAKVQISEKPEATGSDVVKKTGNGVKLVKASANGGDKTESGSGGSSKKSSGSDEGKSKAGSLKKGGSRKGKQK
ncbi:Protein MB21D2 [Mizuhopecten yessoensis]|uniref:Protein MB21D2 n=2 Tax=Mizuhopecten yessoensis TaxID=6573 RepID=A0A210PU48_MIZYE|nr:Protein MB21D2 [Mizuhopecten yessoensis]